MKLSKFLLSGALLAGFAASASAQSTVHVVGSTAFRAGATTAIIDYLSAYGPVNIAFKNASPSGNVIKDLVGAGAAVFTGTLPNSDAITVETFWTGSLAGTIDVALSGVSGIYTGKYVAISSTTGNTASLSTTDNGNAVTIYELSSVTNDDPHISGPEIAMSDSDLTSIEDELADVTTSLASPNNTAPGLINTITAAGLTDGGVTAGAAGTVAVIPFKLILGNATGGGESASNITSQALKSLASKGYVQFSQLSGVATDGTNFAVLVGRSEDSGSRIDTLSESQAEEAQNWDFAPKQVNVSFGGTVKTDASLLSTDAGYNVGGPAATVASIKLWPNPYALNPTQPSLSWNNAGHSGQYSGGDVANVLSAANNGFWSTAANVNSSLLSHTHVSEFTAGKSVVSLVGYAGLPDSVTAVNQGATALSYNGVPYSYSAVESGQYSLWGYEHLYYTSAFKAAAGDPLTFANGLADEIFSTDADIDVNGTGDHVDQGQAGTAAGVLYGDMKVKRLSPLGEYIFQK